MMAIRRVVALAVAVALSGTFALAQSAKPDTKKRSKEEQREIEQIVKLVDAVMAGEPAPTDIQMAITPYFLKSQEQRTFVPFVLDVTGAPEANTALYVRVVDPSVVPDPKAKKKVEYPWDDIHFVQAGELKSGKLNRVFMAAPGSYDVYVGIKERLPEKAPKSEVAKVGVLKQQIVVPDFQNAELNTSSVLVTDKVNILSAPISADESRERPFVFGLQELVPAADMSFGKTEELSIFFQVYNAGLDQAGKPNIVMEYEFHKKEGEGEKFFNKTNPQNIGADNLPPQFDPTKFPVPGGITVPLTSFPEGQYRLSVKISDKVAGKVLNRDINFEVKAS
ncbi:MAG: hypothetical protein OEW19_10525 [Acidobacteriota bacterium]|nr:hypothetical protein [Acidobacteriota bacterium]